MKPSLNLIIISWRKIRRKFIKMMELILMIEIFGGRGGGDFGNNSIYLFFGLFFLICWLFLELGEDNIIDAGTQFIANPQCRNRHPVLNRTRLINRNNLLIPNPLHLPRLHLKTVQKAGPHFHPNSLLQTPGVLHLLRLGILHQSRHPQLLDQSRHNYCI